MFKKNVILLGLSALLAASLTGCGKPSQTVDLTQRIIGNSATNDPVSPADAVVATEFGVRLFQQSIKTSSEETENTLISPVSVLYALSMTANGAEGETLAQMENVLGASVSALNKYLYDYRTSLPQGDKYQLKSANSIWFRDSADFTVKEDFLVANVNWYDAGIYKAPFNSSTVKDINKWVSDNTDKMIPGILNEIPAEAVMYLINALSFDAEWDIIYKENQIRKDIFTEEDGTQYKTELMYDEEHAYLKDDNAQGFLKYYKDKKYAFAALLPDEGIRIADYIETLKGESLHQLLANPISSTVQTAIPKFEVSYDTEMSSLFQELGMTNAFDPNAANFSGISSVSHADGNLYINRILHKTYISVDERGTRAGAVTAVEMDALGALLEPPITLYLNRPFVYMIIDCEENVPLFIGTMMTVRP